MINLRLRCGARSRACAVIGGCKRDRAALRQLFKLSNLQRQVKHQGQTRTREGPGSETDRVSETDPDQGQTRTRIRGRPGPGTMRAGCVLLLLSCELLLAAELQDVQEKHVSPARRRLSLQSTAEIQSCLVSSGDVGCGTFQCFNNNSCEIHGLHHICLTLLHNAGRYDAQGKWIVKEALRCMALGLRQRFSCVSRRCSAVEDLVFSLQRECYSKHQLCAALRDHLDTTGDLVQFHLLFPPGPYVELMNFLLQCGDGARLWVGRQLRGQCEKHWGALCGGFSGACSHSQSDAPQLTTAPSPTTPRTAITQGPQPTRASGGTSQTPNGTERLSLSGNLTAARGSVLHL